MTTWTAPESATLRLLWAPGGSCPRTLTERCAPPSQAWGPWQTRSTGETRPRCPPTRLVTRWQRPITTKGNGGSSSSRAELLLPSPFFFLSSPTVFCGAIDRGERRDSHDPEGDRRHLKARGGFAQRHLAAKKRRSVHEVEEPLSGRATESVTDGEQSSVGAKWGQGSLVAGAPKRCSSRC